MFFIYTNYEYVFRVSPMICHAGFLNILIAQEDGILKLFPAFLVVDFYFTLDYKPMLTESCSGEVNIQLAIITLVIGNFFQFEIFRFIRYANYTTYYFTEHNNLSNTISNFQRDRYIPHKSADTNGSIVVYTRTAQF